VFEYFNLELLDGYGITETSTMVTMNWSGKERNMGSCGLPLPGMSVRIIDGNDLDVKPGEEGELICRGPNVMIGYHKKENETDNIFIIIGFHFKYFFLRNFVLIYIA
jgi:long-subunit acyl-CoA synthetase (AMP-forming)